MTQSLLLACHYLTLIVFYQQLWLSYLENSLALPLIKKYDLATYNLTLTIEVIFSNGLASGL